MPVEKTVKKVVDQKRCPRCKEIKKIEWFSIYKSGIKGGKFHSYCKPCDKINMKRNRTKWSETYRKIHARCNSKKHPSHKWYKDREMNISIRELKIIWFRDKAYELKRPSIDRIDNNKGYFFDNLRYIELSENVRKYWKYDRFNKVPPKEGESNGKTKEK